MKYKKGIFVDGGLNIRYYTKLFNNPEDAKEFLKENPNHKIIFRHNKQVHIIEKDYLGEEHHIINNKGVILK